MRKTLKLLAVLPVAATITVHSQAAPPRSAPRVGTVQALTVHSDLYHSDRDVFVYTPPGYDAKKAGGYPLLVTFDGAAYQSPQYMGLPSILDSLLGASAAPPFVAVMINSASQADRIAELGNSKRYVQFLGDELIPWVRRQWNVTRDPHRTIITGSSAGGLGAAFAAFARPDLFGNVLSQSGALWRGADGSNSAPYEWLTAQIASADKRDVRFLMDVGARETLSVLGGTGPVFIEANRRFRDALLAKGYHVDYTEVPGGVHAPITWRPRFPVDLVTLVASWQGGMAY